MFDKYNKVLVIPIEYSTDESIVFQALSNRYNIACDNLKDNNNSKAGSSAQFERNLNEVKTLYNMMSNMKVLNIDKNSRSVNLKYE